MRSWELVLWIGWVVVGQGCISRTGRTAQITRSQLEMAHLSLASGELEDAMEQFNAVRGREPMNRAAYAGGAQVLAMQGYGDPDGWGAYRAARELGLECLKLDRGFAARVESAGGVLTAKALERVELESWECLYWVTWSWARWVLERGASAMVLDHEILAQLGARGLEIAPDDRRAQALALQALTLSAQSDRLSEADALFRSALEADPSLWSAQVDRAEYVLLPLSRTDEAIAALAQVGGESPSGEIVNLERKKAAARSMQLLSRWSEGSDALGGP